MKPENKAARAALNKTKETAHLHPWQKGKVIRKTKRAFRYEVFDGDGACIGFITTHGKVR